MVGPLYTTASGHLWHAGKIIIVAVGLPARGKTHICRALERYLRWCGVKTQVISLGDFRRKTLGGAQKLPPDYFTFGKKSPETAKLRKMTKDACEQLILDFFDRGGQVAIYDANNGTRASRRDVAEKFEGRGVHVIFMESACDDRNIVEANIRGVKISSPDYKGWDPEEAVKDYWSRIKDHEKYYEPVEELDWPFIRLIDVGEKIMVNRIEGYLQSRIVFFLMNIHNRFRVIYFARSGQSLIEHSYKADSDLSPAGWEYAERLKDAVRERRTAALRERGLDPDTRRLVIWTSTRRRSHHTAWPFAGIGASASAADALFGSGPTSVLGTPPHGTVFATSPPGSASASVLSAPGSAAMPSFSASPPGSAVSDGEDPPPLSGGALPGPALPLPPAPSSAPASTPACPRASFSGTPVLHGGAPAPRGSFGAGGLRVKIIEKPQMLEINPGAWDGLTPDDARALYPDEWARFVRDPYAFRAPRAESYHDLSVRLEPVLIELEREAEDLLIIGHASVIRCLLAYLIGLPPHEVPAVEVARGDLLEVIPTSYGVRSHAFHFWSGPGREDDADAESDDGDDGLGGLGGGTGGKNFYENIAEGTRGKRMPARADADGTAMENDATAST